MRSLMQNSGLADVLIALVGEMKAAYRSNAQFVTNKATLFEVASFKDSAGRYIFNPISAPGVPQTLMNYPILEAEDMPAKAANSLSIAFGDFRRGYLIVAVKACPTKRAPLGEIL